MSAQPPKCLCCGNVFYRCKCRYDNVIYSISGGSAKSLPTGCINGPSSGSIKLRREDEPIPPAPEMKRSSGSLKLARGNWVF